MLINGEKRLTLKKMSAFNEMSKGMESIIPKNVVIEICVNCKSHAWNTKHDESKY